MNNKIRTGLYFLGGFLFLLDRYLKAIALNDGADIMLWHKIGWHPWLNTAGAFSFPLANSLIVILSLPLFAILIYLIFRLSRKSPDTALCFFWILLGALSNIFDRSWYAGVIDYIFIFWGTINIADILILSGAVGSLISTKKT